MEVTSVSRALPIDGTLVDGVLLRLRRDIAGSHARWTLGARGSIELDVHFMPVLNASRPGPTWVTTARLWDPDHLAVARLSVELSLRSAETCELELRPSVTVDSWWATRAPALAELAAAALDELAEEILWHATRPDVAQV